MGLRVEDKLGMISGHDGGVDPAIILSGSVDAILFTHAPQWDCSI